MRLASYLNRYTVGYALVGAAVSLVIFALFPMCLGDNCSVQGWLSASSGWAAAFAALVTLNVMREQVQSQNKQIRFLMGENPPIAEHWKAGYFGTTIRVVNWNQTKFIINALEIHGPEALEIHSIAAKSRGQVTENRFNSEDIGLHTNGMLDQPVTIPGWENRNIDPPEIFIEVPCQPKSKSVSESDTRPMAVVLKGHLSGPTREKIVISVTIPLNELAILW